ncbi:MAG: HAMP domain-containing histidine kinase [Anaerolineae bacterium]|nr:HAMP domain-containing histidine kinase [Anaerolineae bacterium]
MSQTIFGKGGLVNMFKSLRLRLITSYALLSLLVVAALGGALILMLLSYYANQERSYLQDNAAVIAQRVQVLMLQDTPDNLIGAQLQSMAFLSQIRVKLWDDQHRLISDTGPWQGVQVSMVSAINPYSETTTLPANGSTTITNEAKAVDSIIVIKNKDETIAIRKPSLGLFRFSSASEPDVLISNPETVNSTIYGLKLGGNVTYKQASPLITATEMVATTLDRSGEVVSLPVTGADGKTLANLEISEGPAYGQEIVNSVVYSLVMATILALLIAVLAGWWTSQWISAPLTTLTGAAQRMSLGDLAVRVDETGRMDEFGELGRSFNHMAGSVQTTIQSLQRFVADAAHQIQTPITALRTDLELANGEQNNAALQRSQAEVLRLQSLVDELLKLSRFEAGLPLQRQWLDLSALLSQLGETYAGRAEQHDLKFNLDVEKDIRLKTDEYSLAQVLENLLDNALKFTPGGGQVGLFLTCEQGLAVIQVEDSGPGINPEDKERIFERFYRGAGASNLPGSGLGLAIVRVAVNQLGGVIKAENKPEGGACFSLSLPLNG